MSDERLRRAAAAIGEMRARITELERSRSEAIAIVGMACRFPGGADTPERFWEILRDGRETLGPVPRDRWDNDAYYDPDPDAYWKTDIRAGHFIDQPIDAFEPEFFGISPREAMSLDPQQRLLLEVTWESLENAGIAPDRLLGSDTGVYVGTISTDYGRTPFTDVDPGHLAYLGTGNGSSFEAGRISYALGLNGPCMVVATACSSTLVTTHLAAQALRDRECDLALSGGVSLMVHPDTSIILSQMRATAPDGRSKTFDRHADGFGRGEGCGVLVLKRLSDAVRDGDEIAAVVYGSAVNHDGATGGITVPNGPAQERVIRRALATGGHDPEEIDLIEAHGTGTPLGDPIELHALGTVFGGGRAQPLSVGSVKTNIGHLEAAAGAAGLMKLALALGHEQMPAHRNVTELTDKVDWEQLALSVPTAPVPWPRGERRRLAGVSGFGMSGINAHVVVGEPPDRPAPPPAAHDDVAARTEVLLLSARTEPALAELRVRYAELLERPDPPQLADVCAGAAHGRARLGRRLAVTASDRAAAARVLRDGDAEADAQIEMGTAAHGPRRTVFLFTGQGSQHPGMGRALYHTEELFRDTLDHCQAVLGDTLDRPLLSVMFADEDGDRLIDQTAYAQPALFALELGLARLWQSWGVTPDVVIGHSIGEYPAAVIAGILDADEALLLVAERARRMQAVTQRGAMTMIAATEDEVRDALVGLNERVSIAAVNGPRNVVISGAVADVEAVVAGFTRRDVRTRELVVSHAFHSPLMADVAREFMDAAAGVSYSPARIPMVANLSGQADEALETPAYWSAQIRGTVRFHAGLESIARDRPEVFVEIGPQPVLSAIASDSVPDAQWLASLSAAAPDDVQIKRSLAALVVAGGPGDITPLYDRRLHRRVRLPNYPFQRKRYWMPLKDESHPIVRPSHLAPPAVPDHPLLGRRVAAAGATAIFESRLSARDPGYLTDHRIHGVALLPAAGFLEMALAAGRALLAGGGPPALDEVALERPLLLPDDRYVRVQLHAREHASGRLEWEIHSLTDDVWTRHATGLVGSADLDAPVERVDLAALQADCSREVSVESFYELVSSRGLGYGPAFRALRALRVGESLTLGRVELEQPIASAPSYEIAPPLLDACLQALGATFPHQDDADVFLPVGLKRLTLRGRPGACHWVRARLGAGQNGGPPDSADFDLLGEHGEIVAEVRELRFARAPRAALLPDGRQAWRRWLFAHHWARLPEIADDEAPAGHGGRLVADPGSVLLLGDASPLATELAGALRAAGHPVNDAGRPSEVGRLLRELAADGGAPATIVYLAPADGWRTGAGGLLGLIQALAAAPLPSPPRLAIVSVDCVSVSGEAAPGWEQLTCTGMAKAIAREHPELACRTIDVSSQDERPAAALARELLDGGAVEPLVALRGGRRWGARLRPAAPVALTGAPIRAEATYLIAGGLGGLGRATAEHLLACGAGRVLLAGRTPPPADVAAALDALPGGIVEFVAADLGDSAQVTALVRRADTPTHPLRGVFNLAATFDDGIILNQDIGRFARVFAPKVEGSLHLDRATRSLALEHFVLFGSTAALFGNPGQASYGAANAFLGGLADHRRALGLVASTIDWGAWAEVGAASDPELSASLQRRGVQTIAVRDGLEALDHVLARGSGRVAVLPIDRGVPPDLAGDPLVAELVDGDGDGIAAPRLAAELEACAPDRRRPLLLEHAAAVVAGVLGLEDRALLRPQAAFFEIGMDSMMALEVRNQLGAALGVALPASLALDHPTLERLTDHLLAVVFGAETNGEAEAPASVELSELLEEIETLSDDDLQARLRR
jgi:acyl transferase domain-containing protein/acyl carrier protein